MFELPENIWFPHIDFKGKVETKPIFALDTLNTRFSCQWYMIPKLENLKTGYG